MSTYDVERVRADYPALLEGLVHLDGPGGTQVPGAVAAAVAAALRSAVSNRHGPFSASARADALVDAGRAAVADVVGADPRGVTLGPSMTALTYRFAGAFAKQWGPGDEVVVSRLDHDSDVRPWVQAAERSGATVRWAEVDLATGELPVEQYDTLVGPRTRLVAVTAGSNAIGTRPDLPAIAERVHAVGGLLYVDGVHATAHVPIDMAAEGADLWACSSYKFSGPHLGAVVGDPVLLASLHPDKLLPSDDAVPDRFELGTGQFELYAGLDACVDHLADLVPGEGSRRERVLRSMAHVEEYEAGLLRQLLGGLDAIEGVTVHGRAARRTPTVAFTHARRSPREVAAALGQDGICVWDGNYYALELMQALGLEESGGAVRVGISLYTTADEVRRFLEAVAAL